MKNQKKVSSASAYRQNLAVPVELPSEAVFLLRKVNIKPYLKNGRMPEELFKSIIDKWQSVSVLKTEEAEAKLSKKLTKEEIEKMILFQIDIVSAACIEPKIVVDAELDDDSTLDPNDLDPDDFFFIFIWAVSGGDEAERLKTFRRKRRSGSGVSADGRTLRTTPVGNDRNRR